MSPAGCRCWKPPLDTCTRAPAPARKAEQILESMRRRRLTQYVSPVDVAHVFLGLGDADGVMMQLEEAYHTRAVRMVIAGDPFFAELEPDRRYRDLMVRLRLPIRR